MSTDQHWEQWGARDPYFGVLTHPKFRSSALTDEAKDEFFAFGKNHVDHVLNTCRRYLDPGFAPQRVLDFGCGVGRLVLPFAQTSAEVVGVDVSPSMLAEARRNCEQKKLQNVKLVMSDDTLSAVTGQFDLVHTVIVIQHIDIGRGLALFEQLVKRVRPGGIGALHVTFAWHLHDATHGVPPNQSLPQVSAPASPQGDEGRSSEDDVGSAKKDEQAGKSDFDPEMQMNYYNMSQLMFIIQRAGCGMVHSELTDHGGAIGAFMFFRRYPA